MSTAPQRSAGHVVVVGAGIAGLAAAWELLSGPGPVPAVTVLEQADHVGGKLLGTELAGVSGPVAVDAGAESMLARRPEGTALAREVGLGEELVSPAATDARVASRGRLHRLPAGTVLGVPTDPDRLVGGLFDDAELARVAADATAGPDELTRAVAAGADVAVGELVARRMGDAVVDRLVEPLLGGVYAGHARELSLQLTSPALAAALRDRADGSLLAAAHAAAGASRPAATTAGGVTAGGVTGGGAATDRAAGGSATGDARTGTPVFAGLRGGVGRLPVGVADAIRARGGVVRTGTAVRELAPTPDGWRLVTGPVPHPVVVDADAVVLAVPAAAAARLLRSAGLAGSADGAAGIEAASVALVHLAVRAEVAAGLTGSGVLVPPVEGRVVKAATWSSRKWAWQTDAAPDTVVLRASVGRYRETAELSRPDGELVDAVLADLAVIAGVDLRAGLVDARVTRWGGGLPQYAVGHADRVAAVRSGLSGRDSTGGDSTGGDSTGGDSTAANLTGGDSGNRLSTRAPLELAGAAWDGVGIPACIASGRRAGAAVRAALAARTASAVSPARARG